MSSLGRPSVRPGLGRGLFFLILAWAGSRASAFLPRPPCVQVRPGGSAAVASVSPGGGRPATGYCTACIRAPRGDTKRGAGRNDDDRAEDAGGDDADDEDDEGRSAVFFAQSVDHLRSRLTQEFDKSRSARGIRAGSLPPPPSVVVSSRAPDETPPSAAEDGNTIVVVPALSTASGAVVSSQPAPPEAAIDGSIPHDLTLSWEATADDVTNEQKDNRAIRNSFWPLSVAAGHKRVVPAIFRKNRPRFPQNYFQRSATTLQDRLRSVTYVTLPGVGADANEKIDEATWTDRDGTPFDLQNKLVTSVTLQAPPPAEANMKVRREVLLYDPAVFDEHIVDSFRTNYATALKSGALDQVDVTVEVFNKPAYVTSLVMVVITAASASGDPDAALDALFPNVSRAAHYTQLLVDPVDIHGMGTPMADRTKAFHLPSREFGGDVDLDGAAADRFFPWLKEAVRAAADHDNPNLQAHFRLTPEDGQIHANVLVFDADAATRQRPGIASRDRAAPKKFPARPPNDLVELGSSAVPPAAVKAPDRARALETPSPKLEFLQTGQLAYDNSRGQYASYLGSYKDDQFKPFRIATPTSVDDVIQVVKFAIDNNKRAVVRSGGHQYCGFSSGDQNYVQIVMDYMKGENVTMTSEPADVVKARGCSLVSPDDDGVQHFVSVAPRCRLEDLSAALVAKQLTIPHGECPKVGIGGHVQTGGYGHQMRGLGLCLDHVYSFDIVICTRGKGGGASPDVRKVTVYRPELNLRDGEAPDRDRGLNDELYKGVLGGSPGAFGVITRIKFLALHDKDPAFSNSNNVQKVYPYQGGSVDVGAAQVVRTMLKLASRSAPKLCDGLDVFVTILSYKILNLFEWGIVVPELAYTGSDFSGDVKKQMDEILDACGTRAIPGTRGLPIGQALEPRTPSVVAQQGVRTKGGGVTPRGREFDNPYKKRVNVMLDTARLSERDADTFAQGFGELASKVVRDKDLLLVIQMNLGGGKAYTYGKSGRTGIPYRNQLFGFVFDVFYTDARAQPRAEAIQSEMQVLLDRVGHGCFNHRLFWGSFGRERGETDMSRASVQELYYGSPTAYKAMQAIKNRADPYGVFTTEFTVQNR
jgi:FAD binding domain